MFERLLPLRSSASAKRADLRANNSDGFGRGMREPMMTFA